MKHKAIPSLLLMLTLIMLMCMIFVSNISVIAAEPEAISTDDTGYVITAKSAQY